MHLFSYAPIFQLIYSQTLSTKLKPDDTIEYSRYNEWLLCEVICDILGDAHIVKSAREDLNCEVAP